jgi:hypothetical protein
MLPRPTIEAFDRHLLGLGLRFEGVPEWPQHVRSTVADLARRLGHGV